MIAFLGASAIVLSALQASITAPTTAFRGCLHDAAAKATTDKVAADGIEKYLRDACTVQLGSLKEALIGVRMKNGMTRKAADNDAEMTIADYVSTPADNYKFLAQRDAKAAAAAKPAATPAAMPTTPAATTAAAPATQPTPPQKH